MKSSQSGADTSIEVSYIGPHGIWVDVEGSEYFLPHAEFPWFREARIREILNVELQHASHLYWPDLDVDLCLDCLTTPEKYPLIAH